MTEMECRVYRMTYFLVFVEAAIITVLFVLLLALYPLKETRFAFLQVEPKGEQVVLVEPLEKTTPAHALVSESLGREYVILRETIDPVVDNLKMGRLNLYSSTKLHEAYEKLLKDEASQINQFRYQDLKREVRIESSVLLDENTLQINWHAVDRQADNGIVREEKNFTSLLKFNFDRVKLKGEAVYLNPLGFVVQAYTLRFRKAL